MKKNLFTVWEIDKISPDDISIVELHDTNNGVKIAIKTQKRTLVLLFERPLAYQNTDEGFVLTPEYMHFESEESRHKVFYKVEHSSFLEFFHERSQNIIKNKNITHFCIATNEDFIDILSIQEPIIEWSK